MQEVIVHLVSQYGYLGVFLLIAIENIFPPIPSEIILAFGGFMTTYSSLTLTGVVLFSTAGSVAGAVVLYSLGRMLNARRLEILLNSSAARRLRLKQEDIRQAGKWFNRYGSWAVFLCRFIPIVRSLVSIPAGMAKMRMTVFLPLTILGTLVWNTVLVYLGRLAGEAWVVVASYLDVYSLITLVAFALLALAAAAVFIKKRFIQRR
ncbi:MAG TPA: DedA family protein [Firmicutes bacterium]|nr:DedA family protein [Bacillota bacterium]